MGREKLLYIKKREWERKKKKRKAVGGQLQMIVGYEMIVRVIILSRGSIYAV